jgi:hypothetical protein
VFETDGCGEVVESGVQLAVSGLEGVGAPGGWALRWMSDHTDEWAEEACPKLDEKNAELQAPLESNDSGASCRYARPDL